MTTRHEYRDALNLSWRRFKDGHITKEEFENRSDRHFEDFLAQEHLRDNSNRRIFRKIIHKAKNRYALAKDRYYYKDINVQQYIWNRGLEIGMGIGLYDSRLVELGLGTQLLPTAERELFSWESLKLERDYYPPSLRDPDNFHNCPPENAISAGWTMYKFLELMDFYNENYVPSLAGDHIIRDMAWVELPEEVDAYDIPPYLEVELTPAQIRNFERLRDGQGPPDRRGRGNS